MFLYMILVDAHDMWCRSRPGEPAMVSSLFVCDKKVEVLPDEHMG